MSYHSPKKIQHISEKHLRECLLYDEKIGDLLWKVRPQDHFKTERDRNAWNRRYAGKVAGSLNEAGYVRITFDGISLLTSHICWLFGTGKCPQHPLDHINGNRRDNRLVNLREAPGSTNHKNTRLPADNKTGIVGINPRTHKGKHIYFVATVRINRRQLTKTTKSLEAAIEWRNQMVALAGDYHPNHGRV